MKFYNLFGAFLLPHFHDGPLLAFVYINFSERLRWRAGGGGGGGKAEARATDEGGRERLKSKAKLKTIETVNLFFTARHRIDGFSLSTR